MLLKNKIIISVLSVAALLLAGYLVYVFEMNRRHEKAQKAMTDPSEREYSPHKGELPHPDLIYPPGSHPADYAEDDALEFYNDYDQSHREESTSQYQQLSHFEHSKNIDAMSLMYQQ